MDFPVMAATERYGELITCFSPERSRLRKAEMVGICWAAATDQAGLLGDRFDMLPIANPTPSRQCQYVLSIAT
jgi:hypothetical protein